MARVKKYSLSYWVKQRRGYAFAREYMVPAVSIYYGTGAHPEIEFVGTAIEFANALYRENYKRGGVNLGAFLTPLDVAGQLADSLGDITGKTVLDPCAGIGNLVYAVGQRGGFSAAWEYQPILASIAQHMGINVLERDGLTENDAKPDAIIINPPFGNMLGHTDIAIPFMLCAADYGVPVAAILPSYWLEKTEKRYQAVAERFRVLREESLPDGTFTPLTNSSTKRYLLEPR